MYMTRNGLWVSTLDPLELYLVCVSINTVFYILLGVTYRSTTSLDETVFETQKSLKTYNPTVYFITCGCCMIGYFFS